MLKVVIFGGHIDSWDVGQGALDDGSGVAVSWQVMTMVAALVAEGQIPPPRRSMRLVLWTDEVTDKNDSLRHFAFENHQIGYTGMLMNKLESENGIFNNCKKPCHIAGAGGYRRSNGIL